jgi:hypothetical protein
MADETKKPSTRPATTPKDKTGTELKDEALGQVSGGVPGLRPIGEPPPPPPLK